MASPTDDLDPLMHLICDCSDMCTVLWILKKCQRSTTTVSEQKCLSGKMACRFETGGHQGTSLLAKECQLIGGSF